MPEASSGAATLRPEGKGTSTLAEPYPRPKAQGDAGITTRPSSQWIIYGQYRSKREKKIHNRRAAQLRMKLRQVIRAWHTFVESNRLFRQQCLTDIMVRAPGFVTFVFVPFCCFLVFVGTLLVQAVAVPFSQESSIGTGFARATIKLAARRQELLRNRGRRNVVDSGRVMREAAAASTIVRACRSFLVWLRTQPWYGISKYAINPITTTEVVVANARRAAAERVVGNYLTSWAHKRKDEKAAAKSEQLNRVRRRVALHKIETMYVMAKKRRLYHYALMVSRTLLGACSGYYLPSCCICLASRPMFCIGFSEKDPCHILCASGGCPTAAAGPPCAVGILLV